MLLSNASNECEPIILKTPLSDLLNSKREMETIEEIKESQPVSTHQLLRRVYNDSLLMSDVISVRSICRSLYIFNPNAFNKSLKGLRVLKALACYKNRNRIVKIFHLLNGV